MSKQQNALRLALEALEVATTPLAKDRQEVLRAITALREALAEQPAQGCDYCTHPLYAGIKCPNCGREQPAQQEPVAWKHDCAALLTNDVELWIPHCPHCGKPRTSQPAQRTWVGLTDEDLETEFGFIDELLRDCCYRTETKLKEKNNV